MRGSGGALLLEAPSVSIAGTLAANGGGGGGAGGDETAGASGSADARAASGGSGLIVGGAGSGGTTVEGEHVSWDPTIKEANTLVSASGGGGGVDRSFRSNVPAAGAMV